MYNNIKLYTYWWLSRQPYVLCFASLALKSVLQISVLKHRVDIRFSCQYINSGLWAILHWSSLSSKSKSSFLCYHHAVMLGEAQKNNCIKEKWIKQNYAGICVSQGLTTRTHHVEMQTYSLHFLFPFKW